MFAAVTLVGQLNIAVLGNTFNEIIRRHENLRACFSTLDGKPIQVIREYELLTIEIIDLSMLDKSEQEPAVKLVAHGEAQRPFDLSKDRLIRVKLVCVADDQHVLLLTMHHIVSDGWSLGVLLQEINVLYDAFVQDRGAPLPKLPIQYADFSVWQRNWLQEDIMNSQLAYWKQELRDLLPLQLITDKARRMEQSFSGGSISVMIEAEVTAELRKLSRTENATLYMTLLAAFLTLLMRYTRQRDIAIGTPIANRNRTELEGLIGFFVNTLVIRSDMSGDPSFREMVARVRHTALAAFSMQDVPFEVLVEHLCPERSLAQNPIIQVMFALQNAPMPVPAISGLTLRAMRLETSFTRFDMEVHIWEKDEYLECQVVYSSDLFYAETIRSMFTQYRMLLRVITVNPDQPLSELTFAIDMEQEDLTEKQDETTVDLLLKEEAARGSRR
jgi:hypothetical protein